MSSSTAGAAFVELVRKENGMTTIQAFIKRHPVLTYYTLTFAISWSGRNKPCRNNQHFQT